MDPRIADLFVSKKQEPGTDPEVLATAAHLLTQILQSQKHETAVTNFPEFPKSIKTPDMEKVVAAIKQLPTPEAPDDSAITDALNQLSAKYDQLAKTLTGLLSRIDFQPKITVPAPVVKVSEPDLTPIVKAIQDSKPEPPESLDLSSLESRLDANLKATKGVSDTLMRLKFPTANVPTDPLIKYTPADIDDATNIQYYGYISADGSWYIRKVDGSGSTKSIRFSFGAATVPSTYPTNWTNRASLTYALWSQ